MEKEESLYTKRSNCNQLENSLFSIAPDEKFFILKLFCSLNLGCLALYFYDYSLSSY